MTKNQQVTIFICLLLGFIFLMQGFGKAFIWGLEKVYQMPFFYGTFKTLLPAFLKEWDRFSLDGFIKKG